MAVQIQQIRGTTEQISAFTGKDGVLAVNTDTHRVHVQDGATAGGIPLARLSDITTPTSDEVGYTNYGFKNVQEALDDLLYESPVINTFTNNVGTVEKGSTVSTVTLSWSTNKTPTALTLNGESIDTGLTSQTLSGLSLTSNTTYTLTMTDEKDATVSKTTSINFLSGVYYGVGTVDADGVDDAFIQSLTKKLASSAKASYTVNASSGQYIYFAFPASYGTPTFNVGGFDGGFELIKTLDYTNSQGYVESYAVYRSENAGLGSTTVTLK